MSEKIGRNAPCLCGSGKKYKKCCLSKQVTQRLKEQRSQPVFLTTTTEEPLMPVRLYYIVHDRNALLKIIKPLKCIVTYDQTSFIVNYDNEIKKLAFPKEYQKAATQMGSAIILANCKIISENKMHVDLKSFSRAVKLIQFIDQYIPREVAEITHAATYNEIFSATSYEKGFAAVAYKKYDKIFASDRLSEINLEEKIHALRDSVADESDQELVCRKVVATLESDMKQPLPLVEKFPTNFYEDGINQLELTFAFRTKLAIEHVKGNKNYSMLDIMRECMSPDNSAL